jgi:hypothetical protein
VPILPSVISPFRRYLEPEHHTILKKISKPYEKQRARQLFKDFSQVQGLPEKRKVLWYKKRVYLSGRGADSLFIVEISRTKLKFYVTAVSMKDPHDYQLIELFRKVGDRIISHLEGDSID